MGEAQKLLDKRFRRESREQAMATFDRSTSRRIKDGLSGARVLQDEADRIARYIKPSKLRNIFDIADAEEVMKSLMTDPRVGDITDFGNLLSGGLPSGRNAFATWLFETFGVDKLEVIKESKVTLKSDRERMGIMISRDVYVIVVRSVRGREFIQFREFKTGQIVGETDSLKRRLNDVLRG